MSAVASLRRRLHAILHLDEPPRRTALAFAVGISIAFCPLYPHTLLVLLCAWAFRLNFLALMAGALVNNPWTVVPILGATFWVGVLVMGSPLTGPVDWQEVSLTSLYQMAAPYAVPFVVGGLLLSLTGAVLSYPVAYYVIARYRARPGRTDGSGGGCHPGHP